jgi:hypothetical protein
MTDITELIKRQAAALRDKSTNELLAKKLEEMAAQLRGVPKPVKVNFQKEIAKEKLSRLEKFGEAMKAGKIKEVNDLLTGAGWYASATNDKGRHYSRKTVKGMNRITVFGSEFKATRNDDILQDWTPVSALSLFLKKNA